MANEKHLDDDDKPNKQSSHSTRNMCNNDNKKINNLNNSSSNNNNNHGNYVKRMTSQLLNASSSSSCQQTSRNRSCNNNNTSNQNETNNINNNNKNHSKNLKPNNQSTFRTAIEDLKKIMNNQEFKQLNNSRESNRQQIYSKVNKMQHRNGSERKEEQHQQPLLNLNGNFQVEETEHGIQIQIKQPHLISVVCSQEKLRSMFDEMPKTSIRIFPLKLGRNTIGSALGNDIILNEPFVQPQHCYIDLELRDNNRHHHRRSKDGHQNQNLLVTFYPLAGLSAIDGVLIDNPYRLNTGKNFSHLFIFL